MKICVVSGDMAPSRICMQPQCFIYNLCRCLMDANDSVRLITDGHDGTQMENNHLDGVPVYRLKSVRHPFVVGNETLVSAISKEKPDIIFWHIGLTSFLHLNLNGVFNIPVVGIFTSPFYGLKDFIPPGLKNVLSGIHDLWGGLLGSHIPSALIKRNTDAFESIIVLSKAARLGLIKRGVRKGKIYLIPPAIDVAWKTSFSDETLCEERRILGFEPDDFVVSYFGSPIAYRGSHTLVKAVSKTIASIPNLKLLMLSRRQKGELTREQRQLDEKIHRLGISEHVRTVSDFLPQEKLIRLVASSNVVALPFEIAPSDVPLSVLEAMTLGKAVISTSVDGIPDYLSNDRGFLIEPGKPETLSRALLKIHSHPELSRRIGENASTYMKQMPLWSNLAREIMMKVLPDAISATLEDG